MFGLKWQLKKLKTRSAPTRTFKADLWTSLSRAYDTQYGASSAWAPRTRFAAVGMLVLVLFFATGTGVYAYESPDVVEGHPLHFVKEGVEGVEGRLARTPEARAQYHAKMMRRRVREALQHADNRAVAERLMNRAADELDMSLGELKQGLNDPAARRTIVEELRASDIRNAPGFHRVLQERQGLREELQAILEEDLPEPQF